MKDSIIKTHLLSDDMIEIQVPQPSQIISVSRTVAVYTDYEQLVSYVKCLADFQVIYSSLEFILNPNLKLWFSFFVQY